MQKDGTGNPSPTVENLTSHPVGEAFRLPCTGHAVQKHGTGDPSPTVEYPTSHPVGEAFRLPCTGHAMQKHGTGNPSPTVGNIMGWYKYQVSKQINQLRNTAGEKVFQRSYYDHVIRNQQDYEEILEYIENNPKRWLLKRRRWE